MIVNEEEILRQSASVKDTRKRVWLKLIGLVFIISLIGGSAAALASYLTLRSAAEDSTLLAQQVQEACSEKTQIGSDLAPFCPRAEDIVEEAPETLKAAEPIPGPAGPAGPTGPPPSSAQVLSAVRTFCRDTGECKADDATASQVLRAVASYCNQRGECRGDNGQDGLDGTNGADGRDAEPVTQEQLVAAVDAYCAENNGCQGPAGEDGEDSRVPGPQGPPGASGVVNVIDNCEPAPEGQVVDNVDASYNANDKTVVIDCTYKDNLPGASNQPS